MRHLTYFIATTLDGRIAAPDGAFDFFPADPGHLAALAQDWGDALPTAFHRAMGSEPPGTRFDTVLMGRGAFEPALQAGLPDPYAHLDTYVYSSTLDPAAHPQVTIVPTDPAAHVRALKATDGGGIWLCGGGRLAAAVAGEIDRLVLKVNPLTVGAGRPLVDGPFAPQHWRLTASQTFESGVILLEYVRSEAAGTAAGDHGAGSTSPTGPAEAGPDAVATRRARGTFEVDLRPGAAELAGAVGRFDFTKTFRGDLDARGAGVMLSAGDPQQGSAGYVALETVTGQLQGRAGGFVLQQSGMLVDGRQTLSYEVVPGSGHGELTGITGTLHLEVDDAGVHHYELEYRRSQPSRRGAAGGTGEAD